MDTLAKGKAKEIAHPGVVGAAKKETCLVDTSQK